VGKEIFIVDMDGHWQATVVLFPCSCRVSRRLLWESQLWFVAPRSVARGECVACESQHRLKSQHSLKSCMRM